MFRITRLGLVALVATLPFSFVAAQAGPDGCTYVRCFLSLKRHPPRLVQGAGATPVAAARTARGSTTRCFAATTIGRALSS